MAYIGNPANLGNLTTNTEMSNLKKSLNNQNTFSSTQRWEQMQVDSAQGGARINDCYTGCTFDGRYIYFTASNSSTFTRYDTTASFNVAASWQQIVVSIAQGGATVSYAYEGCTFDGRYVYFTACSSTTFIRYDTTQSFTASGSWQQMSMWSAQGATVLNNAYNGCTFDGRYVYFSAWFSDTFIRYDTTQSFTTSGSWQQMSMWSAQGATVLDAAYLGCTFDGRYVYFTANNSDTFIRFDSTQSFTIAASWQQMAMWSAQGATAIDAAYEGCTFDGRFVYFTVGTSATLIRYDTTQTFNAVASWQQIAMASAQGGGYLGYGYWGCTFDGRYIYFSAYYSTTFIRYDTTQNFTAIGSWQQVLMSVAQGGAALGAAYNGCTFDGRYIYFSAAWSSTLIRFLANNTGAKGPIEYARVSS